VAIFAKRETDSLLGARPRHASESKLSEAASASCADFMVLSAFVGAFIPFDERIRSLWPFAFAYCAFLAVATIGLVRLGRRVLLLLGVPAAAALAPGAVGFALGSIT
jgi:hypothetical protein